MHMSDSVFVDASLFMSMHSTDDEVRVACKNFFVANLASNLMMSLEQVGLCDDIVWGFTREIQDAYYPFMDNLHTDLKIDRVGYNQADIEVAVDPRQFAGLDLRIGDRLLLSMVHNRSGVLSSVNPRIAMAGGLPIQVPQGRAAEMRFPDRLEQLYQCSLALRVTAESW